jgi:signal transduction histidine kinase
VSDPTVPLRYQLRRVEERCRRLGLEKSSLQLVNNLMSSLSAQGGLEKTTDQLVRLILDSMGGSNVALYYWMDDALHFVDAFGARRTVDVVDDELVRRVIEHGVAVEEARGFEQTGMTTSEFANASFCALPLRVGGNLVGVLKLEGMLIAADAHEPLRPFLDYAALVLKNEIESYSKLWEAYDRLKRETAENRTLELQLHQAQKLEAVGQLAAGLAHEINTPAQFVGDSLGFVKEALQAQAAVLDRSRRALEEAGRTDLVEAVRAVEEEVDLEYVQKNYPEALETATGGLRQIASIVRAMNDFARPGGSVREQADLNRALESTLTIAGSELRGVADVECQLGPLPLVSCVLSELNQVFLALIVNAARAIADVVRGTEARGRIVVRTRAENGGVQIDIQDTGCGIPEAIRGRIFDPFFTTREVGQGGGQGLALAWRVVVGHHGGTLSFESQVGQGTTFTIKLPLGPPAERPAACQPATA